MPHGLWSVHGAFVRKGLGMARDFSKSFYNSKTWKDIRQSILIRDAFLCVKCGKPAQDVHHIIWLTPENINDPKISMSADNLISLCGNCHKQIHMQKEQHVLQEITFDEFGYPVALD